MQEQPWSLQEQVAVLSPDATYQSATGALTIVPRHAAVSSEDLLFILSALIFIVLLRKLRGFFPWRLRGSSLWRPANESGIIGLAASNSQGAAYILLGEKEDTFQGLESAVNFQNWNAKTGLQRRNAGCVVGVIILIAMWLYYSYLLALIGYLPGVFSLGRGLDNMRRQSTSASTTGPLDVFEVYQPVTFHPTSNNACSQEVLLMEHQFGYSYGHPYVGKKKASVVFG